MNKIRKGLKALVLATMLAFALMAGIACKDKEVISVKFETDGIVNIDAKELSKGETFQLPIPNVEGYCFEGWYTDAAFMGTPVTEIVTEANVTYYAKWTKLYSVTVDLAGGSLSATSFYLKPGENIYDFMQDYVPTKEGYAFGRWLMDGAILSKNSRMPEANVSLTAEYKMPYTVQVWEQNLTQSGYEVREITGFEYAGVKMTSEQTLTGFNEVIKDSETEKTVATLTISENSAENIFVHYFDRETYEVTFVANYPDGYVASDVQETVLYGKGVEIPSDYVFDGYCLIGWATSPTGEVVYKSNYIQNALYGAEDVEAESVFPERNIALYGVWQEGYRDMFGNGDYIFLFEDTTTDENGDSKTEYSIYLSRSGVIFKGEYDELDASFFFTNADDKTIVKGRLNDNGTFIYSDLSKAEYTITLFVSGKGLLTTTKLLLDEYDGITYSEVRKEEIDGQEQDITYESYGTYYVDENGYFVASFTEGDLAGQTLTMVVGYVQSSTGEYIRAFQIRNDEEYNLGALLRLDVYNNQVVAWPVYQVILDGFGSAVMVMDQEGNYQSMRYLYDSANQLITFLDNYGEVAGTAFVLEEEIGGKTVKGYAIYSEELDNVYPFEDGVLILDGIFSGSFEKKDGTKVKGYYTLESSAFGGTVVNLKGDDGVDYKFIITRVEESVTMGDQVITTISYYVEQKRSDYAEYYYKDIQAIWYGPVLTVNDPEENKASLYAFTPARTYELISIGSLVYDEKTKLYTYTAEEYITPDVEVNTSPVDLSKISTMICALDTSAASYAIHYWYSYTTEEGTITSDATYTSSVEGDKSVLTLVSGIAILKNGSEVITGQYATDEESGLTKIQTAVGENIYVKIEEKTFTRLEHAPYEAYLLESDGNSITRNVKLSFDGFGGISYTVIVKAESEEEEDVTTVYAGSFKQLDETTIFGLPVYLFTAPETEATEAVSFKFIQIPYGNSYLFAKYNEEYNGTYQSQEYGKLELDGYGYYAIYKDSAGNTYEAKYYIEKENEITFDYEGVYRYFDLKEDGTFTLRGIEFGTYVYANNQYLNNLYFELDGYGKLTVYKMVQNEEGKSERQDVDLNGTYAYDNNEWIFNFVQEVEGELENIELHGDLGTYGDYLVFIEKMSGVAGTYVNAADLSVLILDDIGNAVKHTQKGSKEYGYYTLITGNILYYMNAAATDACIYHYDTTAKTAVISDYEPRGYYTKDLESLIFTEYGFAVFGGQTRYYYDIDDNFNVTIYREAEEGEDHNGYGFVEESFGSYDAQVEYGGKTYFATDGLSITFKRDAGTKDEYPLLEENLSPIRSLSFAPTGDGQFTVSGKVVIDKTDSEGDISSNDYNCTVTRKVDENGNVEFYVTIGGYRFDISVQYKGDNADGTSANTYTVTRMRRVINTYSYTYSYMYYLYYYFMGAEAAASYQNTFGEIVFACEYDKEGNKGDTYAEAKFWKDSKFYDETGTLFTGGQYTIYDMEGNTVALEEIKLSSSKTYVYVLHMQSEGGYQYKLYFAIGNSMIDGIYAYQTVAFVREESLKTDDGYTINVQTVITSDMNYKEGDFFNLELIYGEGDDAVTIKGEAWFEKDGATYYIVREYDETSGLITKTTYYKLSFVKDIDDSLGGETEEDGEDKEETKIVPLYKAVSVTTESVKTIYAENNADMVDLNEATGKITILGLDGTNWIVTSSEYDAETQTYTVKLSEKKVYTVKIVEDEEGNETVTIEEVVQEEETV